MKMSKSKGNFLMMDDCVKRFGADATRSVACLSVSAPATAVGSRPRNSGGGRCRPQTNTTVGRSLGGQTMRASRCRRLVCVVWSHARAKPGESYPNGKVGRVNILGVRVCVCTHQRTRTCREDAELCSNVLVAIPTREQTRHVNVIMGKAQAVNGRTKAKGVLCVFVDL